MTEIETPSPRLTSLKTPPTLTARRRLDHEVIAMLAADLEELEDELAAPTMDQLDEMQAGKTALTHEAVFLGVLGMINAQLEEIIVVFWEGFTRSIRPTAPLPPDCPDWFPSITRILAAIIESRTTGRATLREVLHGSEESEVGGAPQGD